MMDLENTKMESYAENDLIDHLMAFLHETYEKEPMGMVIDCDVNGAQKTDRGSANDAAGDFTKDTRGLKLWQDQTFGHTSDL